MLKVGLPGQGSSAQGATSEIERPLLSCFPFFLSHQSSGRLELCSNRVVLMLSNSHTKPAARPPQDLPSCLHPLTVHGSAALCCSHHALCCHRPSKTPASSQPQLRQGENSFILPLFKTIKYKSAQTTYVGQHPELPLQPLLV